MIRPDSANAGRSWPLARITRMGSLLAACAWACACSDIADQVGPARDLVAESLGLPPPRFEPLPALPGAAHLAPGAAARVQILRAFFARDFAALDETLLRAHSEYVQGRAPVDMASRLIRPLLKTELAGIDACTQWTGALPQSYAAHWVCGEIWQQGAWVARTEKLARDVSKDQFALMRERLERSNGLLQQALGLSDRPIQALTALAANLHLQGKHRDAENLLARARAMMPRHADTYIVAANYAMPQWGGSVEEVQAVIEDARRAGAHADDVSYMQDHNLARPWLTATPGAERAYWESAIAAHPTYDRLKRLLLHLASLKIWRDARDVTDRLIATYPEQAEPHYWRGRANEALGSIAAALADYRMAATMGHDTSIEHLIRAHLNGTLGLPAKDVQALAEVCRFGAALGSGSAANCLGSSHWDGSLPSFARDPVQALAWHLQASRAGHYNSQHDIGWLLLTGRGPAAAPDSAKSVGVFWLRRSAEQGHSFAPKKLKDAGYEVSVGGASDWSAWKWLAPLVAELLAAGAIAMLSTAGNRPARRDGSLRHLDHSHGVRRGVLVLLLASCGVAYAASQARQSQFGIALGITAAFILTSLFLAYHVFLVKLGYDDQFLYYRSPFAGTHKFPWSSVTGAGYSTFWQSHFLRTIEGHKVWLPRVLQGHAELGEFLEAKGLRQPRGQQFDDPD